MAIELYQLVWDFASGIEKADALRPACVSASGRAYSPGIGPHTESRTIELVLEQLAWHDHSVPRTSVPYPCASRQKCDLVLEGEWAVEVKMLRFLGDNGKPNDNILMHILSPYPAHRSALTDCMKLRSSGFAERLAILIYSYDYAGWPMDPAVEAFEASRHAVGRAWYENGGRVRPPRASGTPGGPSVWLGSPSPVDDPRNRTHSQPRVTRPAEHGADGTQASGGATGLLLSGA